MVVQCCVCKKVRVGRAWVADKPPRKRGRAVSHGYCPACAAQAFKEIRAALSHA